MSAQKRRRGAEEEDAMDEDMEAASHDDACESADEGRTTKAPRHDPPSEGESDQKEDDERDAVAMRDCGKIKMIECTNFMCHRRLQVKLGPNINFITGQNGSGKSAIVAALQICLGLSARSTNRGQRLSCLIRHGSNADAVVAVELINEGAEAYQPDLYGSTIRIERTLKSSGASSFRILNGDTRKCVSTRRGTVDDIVKRFNTFVDNPSCILDQETSKTFLRGFAKDKYKVFMRATNLEAHINPLKKAEENLRHARHALKERSQNYYEIFRDKVREAQAELEMVESLRNSEGLLERAKKKKAWITARDFRVKADTAEAEYQAIRLRFLKMEDIEEVNEALHKPRGPSENDITALTSASARHSLEKTQSLLLAKEEERDKLTNMARQAHEGALKVPGGEEIDVGDKTKEQVETDIKHYQKSRQEDRQNLSSQYGTEPLEIVIARLQCKLDRLTKDKYMEKKKVHTHKALLECLKHGNEMLLEKAGDLRETCERKLQKIFETNLSYRQHMGSVDFNQEQETLEFTWSKTLDSQQSQPEAGSSQGGKDAGQLSGGESSFTSLAFLMALGQVMESPWRVMDNFDVFMDHDNRKLSLELIVDSARNNVKSLAKKSCQFILITPHDVSSVSAAPDVRKIRMRPPESEFGRAQQTTLT